MISTNPESNPFEEIDLHGEESVGTWAINPNAREGDLALMYCVTPRSAIVGVYRVLENAHRDPFGGWNGYRAEIGEKIAIPWLKLRDMKNDPVFCNWKLVRSNFQGLLKHEVPEEVWLRFKQFICENDRTTGDRVTALGDAAIGVRDIKTSEEIWSEREVEDKLIIPLMVKLGWKLNSTIVQQVEMEIKVGSGRPHKVRADFVGYSSSLTSEVIIVIEAKKQLKTKKDLEYAQQQAESYAGRLRCPRYAVVSPEGIWIYELTFPGQSIPLKARKVDVSKIDQVAEDLIGLFDFSTCSSLKRG